MRLTLNYHVNDRVLEGVFCYNYQHWNKYLAQGLKGKVFCFLGPLSAWLHVWNKDWTNIAKMLGCFPNYKTCDCYIFPQSSDSEREWLHCKLWNILVYAWAGQNIIKWCIYLIQINWNHKQLVSKRRSFSGSAPLFYIQAGTRKEYTQSPGRHQQFTQNYISRKMTDTNIRWLNVEQVKYCSLLFTSHTGSSLISNPSLNPQTTQASGPIVWNSTSNFQGVWLTPTVHWGKHHIKERHRGCLKATGRRRVKGHFQAGRDSKYREESWLAERKAGGVLLLYPHSYTSAGIKWFKPKWWKMTLRHRFC